MGHIWVHFGDIIRYEIPPQQNQKTTEKKKNNKTKKKKCLHIYFLLYPLLRRKSTG